MSPSKIKKRFEGLATERIRQTDEVIAKARESQQRQPSIANELTIQSLEHRREKLKRS
ncbi:hypothetical protein [Spirosoma arcticum]